MSLYAKILHSEHFRAFHPLAFLMGLACGIESTAATAWEDSTAGLWAGEYSTDDSIANNHASISGALSYASGKRGDGFLLDGSGHLTIQTLEGFAGDNFTFHMWLRPNLATHRELTLFYTTHSRGDTSVIIRPDGQICGRVQWRHGGCTFLSMPGHIKSGVMIHFSIVVSGNTMKIFKNGVLISGGGGNCCYKAQGPILIGSNGYSSSNMLGLIDELQYHNRALTDEEIYAIYSNFIIQNPNPELESALDDAYQEIDELQGQLLNLADTNAHLENELLSLENQSTLSNLQIVQLETQIDQLEAQLNLLDNNVLSLEHKVSDLEESATELNAQIDELMQMIDHLESQVSNLEVKVDALQAELNALKMLLTDSLSLIEIDFRKTFKDPDFEIRGETTEDDIENLVDAILQLNKGRKMGLYKSLR